MKTLEVSIGSAKLLRSLTDCHHCSAAPGLTLPGTREQRVEAGGVCAGTMRAIRQGSLGEANSRPSWETLAEGALPDPAAKGLAVTLGRHPKGPRLMEKSH